MTTPVGASATRRPEPDGRLAVSGALSIISAVIGGTLGTLFFGWAASLAAALHQDQVGSADRWPPSWGTVLILHLVVTVAVMTSGIATVNGRAWGRIATMVVQGLLVVALVVSFVDEPWVGWLIPIGLSSLIFGLAALGDPST